MECKEGIKRVVEEVQGTIGYFVDHFDFEKMNLPLICNSYGLWRGIAFQRLEQMPSFESDSSLVHEFYLQSECYFLKQFIEKALSPSIQLQALASTAEESDNARYLALLTEYNQVLWKHTIYVQLFEDLMAIPYLSEVFPRNKRYRLKHRFQELSPLRNSERADEMVEKVSEKVIKKGFGQIVEKVFTKTFLLRASSVAIRLNPIAIAATFAFSSLVDYYKKEKKEEQLLLKIEEMIAKCKQNIELLVSAYQESLGFISAYLRKDPKGSTNLIEAVYQVIEVDWLQVTRSKDDDGWEIVILEGDPERG